MSHTGILSEYVSDVNSDKEGKLDTWFLVLVWFIDIEIFIDSH